MDLFLGEPLLDFLSFFGRLGTQDYMVTLGNYGKEKGTSFFRQWFVGNFHLITWFSIPQHTFANALMMISKWLRIVQWFMYRIGISFVDILITVFYCNYTNSMILFH